MNALIELQTLGYRAWADGEKLRLHWQGEGEPPAERVRPLLKELKERKDEALVLLAEKADTCLTCGERFMIVETERYREVECPTHPLHFYRLTNKHPGKPMFAFTDEPVSTVWDELLAWAETTIPMAAKMREYLGLSHFDNFGQQEIKALRAAEAEIDSILTRIQREGPSDELSRLLEEAKVRYQRVWREIEALFTQTYPGMFRERVKDEHKTKG